MPHIKATAQKIKAAKDALKVYEKIQQAPPLSVLEMAEACEGHYVWIEDNE